MADLSMVCTPDGNLDTSYTQRQGLARIGSVARTPLRDSETAWRDTAASARDIAGLIRQRLDSLLGTDGWSGRGADAFRSMIEDDLLAHLDTYATTGETMAGALQPVNASADSASATASGNDVPWDREIIWTVERKDPRQTFFGKVDEFFTGDDDAYEEAKKNAPYNVLNGARAVMQEVPKERWESIRARSEAAPMPPEYALTGTTVSPRVNQFDHAMEALGLNNAQRSAVQSAASDTEAKLAAFTAEEGEEFTFRGGRYKADAPTGTPTTPTPGTSGPGTSGPGIPVTATPDFGAPGAGFDGGGPGGDPSYEVPGADGPGSQVPGADGPGARVPGADGPGYDGPGYEGPGYDGPGAELPGDPGAQIPGYDGPGAQVPGYDGPGSEAPGFDGPGYEIPGFDGPGGPGTINPDTAPDDVGTPIDFGDDIPRDPQKIGPDADWSTTPGLDPRPVSWDPTTQEAQAPAGTISPGGPIVGTPQAPAGPGAGVPTLTPGGGYAATPGTSGMMPPFGMGMPMGANAMGGGAMGGRGPGVSNGGNSAPSTREASAGGPQVSVFNGSAAQPGASFSGGSFSGGSFSGGSSLAAPGAGSFSGGGMSGGGLGGGGLSGGGLSGGGALGGGAFPGSGTSFAPGPLGRGVVNPGSVGPMAGPGGAHGPSGMPMGGMPMGQRGKRDEERSRVEVNNWLEEDPDTWDSATR